MQPRSRSAGGAPAFGCSRGSRQKIQRQHQPLIERELCRGGEDRCDWLPEANRPENHELANRFQFGSLRRAASAWLAGSPAGWLSLDVLPALLDFVFPSKQLSAARNSAVRAPEFPGSEIERRSADIRLQLR